MSSGSSRAGESLSRSAAEFILYGDSRYTTYGYDIQMYYLMDDSWGSSNSAVQVAHGEGTGANVWFVDGHADTITIDELADYGFENHTYVAP